MEVTLRWADVNYSIRRKNSYWWWKCKRTPETHHILQNVSGEVSTGDLVAIVGASGAGKTTLLAAISRRIRGNKLAGKFTINSREVDREEMTSISGFVPQSDSLINALTVEEHLMFIGLLKYSRKMPQIQLRITIKKILVQLGLNSLANSRIGTLSGGERKKLNLATELLGEPYFLFCDEPTTGLDSFNALLVIKTLKNLCGINENSENNTNSKMEIVTSEKDLWEPQSQTFPKGIVCSIHQPTSDIFHCFSHMILLREGRIVFQGTTSQAEDKFREAGFICPENYNPIEYYVKIISQKPELDIMVAKLRSQETKPNPVKIQPSQLSTSWILQVFYLLKRSSLVSRRSLKEAVTRSCVYMISSIFLSLFYQSVTEKMSQTSIQDIEGAIFCLCVEIVGTNYCLVIMFFCPQLALIRRETGEKLFSVSAFYTASVLEQLPRTFIESFIFVGIMYISLDFFSDMWTYIAISLSCSFAAVTSMAYGFMIAGVFIEENIVNEVSMPLDYIMMIFGGFYVNVSKFPFIKYTSLFFLTNEAISIQFWREIDYIECTTSTNCLRNGTAVLTYYSFGTDTSAVWMDYLYFALSFIIFHILGYLGLKHYIQKEGFY
ncbi:protein brown-like [Phlebotomus papatasi]|uniref:protein brown-like n=1 Tax=Phlebotomus papatasi TaxID=29031 RepID=UPI002483501E|nr:protein brown-like [Phlebotomus papatasi]